MASWSAHEVFFIPQMFPLSFDSICSTVIPSVSFEIALRFPLHPPVKAILLITSPFISNEIAVEHVPVVLYVYLISELYHVFTGHVTRHDFDNRASAEIILSEEKWLSAAIFPHKAYIAEAISSSSNNRQPTELL